jgi:hypothetical protein
MGDKAKMATTDNRVTAVEGKLSCGVSGGGVGFLTELN